jgi:hypothetical protein
MLYESSKIKRSLFVGWEKEIKNEKLKIKNSNRILPRFVNF